LTSQFIDLTFSCLTRFTKLTRLSREFHLCNRFARCFYVWGSTLSHPRVIFIPQNAVVEAQTLSESISEA